MPCENNKDCVQCKVFGTGKLNSKECEKCELQLEEVGRLELDPNSKRCQFNDVTDNCTFFFSYDILNNKQIRYQKEKGNALNLY